MTTSPWHTEAERKQAAKRLRNFASRIAKGEDISIVFIAVGEDGKAQGVITGTNDFAVVAIENLSGRLQCGCGNANCGVMATKRFIASCCQAYLTTDEQQPAKH